MQTLILGFDAFDPTVFERLAGQGKLPHLTRHAEAGGYARFAVSNPPQSEVSWTSIATGLNPGGHGIFDFVHRDPASYALQVSLLPSKRGMAGVQFVPPFKAHTIFDEAAREGFPATSLWWPATFPARPESPVQTIPGLGTPDIQGRLGVGTFFSTDEGRASVEQKTPVETLKRKGKDRYTGLLRGPTRQSRKKTQESTLELQLSAVDDRSARLTIGDSTVDLVQGTWSPILELSFKMGLFLSVRAITRVILVQVRPDVQLYVLPLQIHPLHSTWRYASPGSFVKRAWQTCGPFLTLGWPQETTALEEGCITDEQFLALCDSILETRERLLMHQLERFHEGLLASVFDSLDRIQHMFWRSRPDVIEAWYVKLDALLGRVEGRLKELGQERTKVVVVSDHGSVDLDYKVHLNRWLVERGHLVTRESGRAGSLGEADWSQSRAYAVGLNSLYVNLAGREGQGCVPAGEYESFAQRLRDELLNWQGPDGRSVVRRALPRDEVFAGPFAAQGPDLVVGYAAGYRASAETGLGKWKEATLEANDDHWGADHCMDAEVVPGVLFCNQGLANFPSPSYRDFPALTAGMEPDESSSAPPPIPVPSEEDEAIVEERLRGLGYL
jgi:predicted AlkP superfamily phosphohydrolase/phosphomutase